jgi:pyruvate dehydrogenase E2 component (dihydrolipoamide acetyltransferase)
MSERIQAITMPKWGMTMTRGTFVVWLVGEGTEIDEGDEIAEIETDKMTGAVEAHIAGRLRRRVADEGDLIDVGGLLAVIAAEDVSDEEVQSFIDDFRAARPASDDQDSPGPESITVAGSLGGLHALAQGEGSEAVIFLHGFGGDALNFRLNLEPVAAFLPIVAMDLPGHGSSTKNVGAGEVDNLASSVVEVMDARGLARVHLVGHSLGALVAAAIAQSSPARVASLALIAPAGFGEQINGTFIDGYTAAGSRREVKAVLQILFADPGFVNRQLVEDVLKYKRLEGVPEGLASIRDALFPSGRQSTLYASELESVDVPLLVIWGSEDQVISVDQANAAPSRARVEIIDAVGHSPHLEASDSVNAVLLDFLAASTVRSV